MGELLSRRPIDDLTYAGDIQQVQSHHLHRSQATRNRYMQYLKAIFSCGMRHRLIKNNPLLQWSRTKELRRQFFLSVEDLKKILQNAEPPLKWAIEVSWNLGTRPGPSELLNIKWDDVDFERGVVRIFGRKTKDWREVAISEEFTRRLLSVREAALSEYLIEYQGRPMKKFRRSFHTACNRAGISYPVRMYDIRHLFASTMLTGGLTWRRFRSF